MFALNRMTLALQFNLSINFNLPQVIERLVAKKTKYLKINIDNLEDRYFYELTKLSNNSLLINFTIPDKTDSFYIYNLTVSITNLTLTEQEVLVDLPKYIFATFNASISPFNLCGNVFC